MGYQTQDYVKHAVRSAAILTNSYVAGTTLSNTHRYNQLLVLVDFTKGSLTSLEVKVEFSADDTTYYQETVATFSAGTSTGVVNEYAITATGKYRLAIPISDRFIKVSVKGTGTVTSSSCTVDAILAVN